MPHVPPGVLDCCAFLYASEADARNGAPTGATAFFVIVPSATGAPVTHAYLVTNAHVIQRDEVVVRLNLKSGGVDYLTVRREQWIEHPRGDDVAVAPVALPFQHYSHTGASTSVFLRKDDVAFGAGDECFFLGRQIGLDGKHRNTPAVRFGAVSIMNPEPILQPLRGFYQESVVVEARSLGGYSGSPVFVYGADRLQMATSAPESTLPRRAEGAPPWEFYSTSLVASPLALLGIDWGHMGARGARAAPGLQLDQLEQELALNSGMMLVVPAWKIQEVLDLEELAAMRAEKEADLVSAQAVMHEGLPPSA